jgi:hypothetical protein
MSTEPKPSGVADEETSVTDVTEGEDGIDADVLSESKSELELDQVFEILKNQRRRYVLQYLDEVEGTVSMSDLAEEIAAWENDKQVSQLSSSERKRVYVGLYQCHLPKMDGMGVVSFNKPRGLIERGPNATVFDQYVNADSNDDGQAWYRLHAVAATAGFAVLASGILLQAVVAGPVVAVAGLLAVTLNVGTSAAHYRSVREVDRETSDEQTGEGPSAA